MDGIHMNKVIANEWKASPILMLNLQMPFIGSWKTSLPPHGWRNLKCWKVKKGKSLSEEFPTKPIGLISNAIIFQSLLTS